MTDIAHNQPEPRKIVFFDGDCGMCNSAVRFLMRMDGRHLLRFAPLQGETAKQYLPSTLRDEGGLNTMVYRRVSGENTEILLRSDAILAILANVGGGWRFLSVCRYLPRSFRDMIYRCIARNRHRLGFKSACELPTAEQRAFLLP